MNKKQIDKYSSLPESTLLSRQMIFFTSLLLVICFSYVPAQKNSVIKAEDESIKRSEVNLLTAAGKQPLIVNGSAEVRKRRLNTSSTAGTAKNGKGALQHNNYSFTGAVIKGDSGKALMSNGKFKLTAALGQYLIADTLVNTNNQTAAGMYSFFQLPPTTPTVYATQGDYADRVEITWKFDCLSPPANIDYIKIYRDNILLATIPCTDVIYKDYNVVPGSYYAYSLTGVNKYGVSPAGQAVGFINPNGTVTGRIMTRNGTPVNEVEVLITPNLGKSLYFNGINTYVDAGSHISFQDTSFTIEFWLKQDAGTGGIFSSGTEGNYVGVDVEPYNSVSSMWFDCGAASVHVPYQPDGNWHHWAWVYDKSTKQIFAYKDSIYLGNWTDVAPVSFANGATMIGKSLSSGLISGYVDEIRIWKSARDQGSILRNMYRTVSSTSEDLEVYWKMDEGKGNRIFDYASKKNTGVINGSITFQDDRAPIRNTTFTNSTGYYIAEGINYGSSTNFTIYPNKPGRSFTPENRLLTLSSSNTAVNNVDFTDISQIPVSGYVYHQGSTCLEDTTVEILVDDTTWSPKITTNAAGKYLVDFSPGETHRLSPSRRGYTFNPAYITVDSIVQPLANKNFTQTSRRSLKVVVAGGECALDLGGQSKVIIKSMPSGCIQDSLEISSPQTYCTFSSLPPMKYSIEVKRPDNIVFEADSVDMQDTSLANVQSFTKKFIYHSPLVVEIDTSYLPTRGVCATVVLEQLKKYKVRYRVGEYYNNGAGFCPVDSAYVTVNNEIGDVSPSYIVGPTASNGYISDSISAAYPNVLNAPPHPYMKKLSVIATAPDSSQAQAEYWAIVTGVKFRGGQTYITRSPEMPSVILHQPPGDLSSSYWARSKTIASQLDITASDVSTYTKDELISLAPKYSVTAGTGFFNVGTEVRPIAQITGHFEYSTSSSTTKTIRQEFTATEQISTAESGTIPSGQGDVFVGGAYNFVFGKTNVIKFNDTTCSVVTDTGIIAAPDSVVTKFIYTEHFIRNTLIPNIYSHALNYRASDSIVVRKRDSVSVRNWERLLAYNDSLKNASLDSVSNISFTAGASITQTRSYSVDSVKSFTYEDYYEGGVGFAGGVFGNDAGFQIGLVLKWRNGTGGAKTSDTLTTIETGFTLADDDVGDFFSVNVGRDRVFNTPVFKTLAGASSCPWEQGTMTRDSAVFVPTSLSAVNVHPDSMAVFAVTLGNAGSTNETRNYLLSVGQQTNPNGLVIAVNGVIIENSINLALPGGGGVQVMITVKRGPLAYDYENVQLFLSPECEPDFLHNGNSQLCATLNLNVHFIKPCSAVNISQPEQGWLINETKRDTILFSVTGYNAGSNSPLQTIKLQYRPSLKSLAKFSNPEFYGNAVVNAQGKVKKIDLTGLPIISINSSTSKKSGKTASIAITGEFKGNCYQLLNDYAKRTPKKYHLLGQYLAECEVCVQGAALNNTGSSMKTGKAAADADESPALLKSERSKVNTKKETTDDVKSSWMTFKTITMDSLLGTSYYSVPWVVSGLNDGLYDLRAVTTCGGSTIDGTSAIVTGTIDKTPPMVQGLPQPVSSILTLNSQIAISFTKPIQCYGLNTTNNIQLFYSSGPQSGQPIDINFSCDGRSIIILPNIADRFMENQVLKAVVKRVKDQSGNTLRIPVGTSYTDSISWEFAVKKSPVRWSGGDITVSKYIDENLSVTRELVNSGGFANSFNIRKVPSWAIISPVSGTVPELGNLPISFTFGTGLGFGTYDTTVVDSTIYGDQPLRINLAVLCHTPEWTVTPSDYQYSMNIVGELYIDTALSRDVNDKVGVFVGNECRGSANVKLIAANRYRVFLYVYSNQASGEQLQMRVWDSSSCSLFGNTIETFTFKADSICGTYAVPKRITATQQLLQQYKIPSGWSWLSFNTRSNSMIVDSVLANLHPTEGDNIKEQIAFAQYNQSMNKWLGSLTTIDNRKMYMLKLAKKDSLSRAGIPVVTNSSPIIIRAGWNYISYLPQKNLTVGAALTTLAPRAGDLIKSQFAFAIFDSSVGWVGSLTYMEPKLGYLLKLSVADTIIYPSVSKSASEPEPDKPEYVKQIKGNKDWILEINNYQYSMNIIARLDKNIVDTLAQNTLIGAFCNNECRGIASPQCVGTKESMLYFLTVYSNSPNSDSLVFRVLDIQHNREVALQNGVRFSADALIGSLYKPLLITGIPLAIVDGKLIPDKFALEQNYPNPFNPTTTIKFAIPEDSNVELTIFNSMGEKIISIVNEYRKAGFYTCIWNGRNEHGLAVPSGVYLYRMQAGIFSSVRKLIFLK